MYTKLLLHRIIFTFKSVCPLLFGCTCPDGDSSHIDTLRRWAGCCRHPQSIPLSNLWAPTAKKARIQSCHSAQRISEALSKAELLPWQCYLSLVQEAAYPGRMWSGQILGCSPPEFPSQRGPKDQAMYTYMCSQKMSFLIPISNPASVPKSRVGFLCRCLLKTAHKYSKC